MGEHLKQGTIDVPSTYGKYPCEKKNGVWEVGKRERLPGTIERLEGTIDYGTCSSRRLGAIPLQESPFQEELPLPTGTSTALPILGVASTALVCIGCALKRRFQQLKRSLQRDSFGYIPMSQRNSLTKADLSV